MSKLKSDNINYSDNFLVVEPKAIKAFNSIPAVTIPEKDQQQEDEAIKEAANIIDDAYKKAQEIIKNAEFEANNIIEKSKKEAEVEKQKIIFEANENAEGILASASADSENLRNEVQKEAEELINSSKAEIEKARTQAANEGYQDGYQDAGQKIQEELEEKIKDFENFCKIQFEIKDKIIKSASKDILDITLNISRKILHKELDAKTIDKIIKSTVLLFEKKENINIILSEKYAKLLYELQKKSLNNDILFKFEDFKQYEGFQVIYNPKYDDDTIILENLKERFDASINSQMDVIIRNILKNTGNGQLDSLEQYAEEKNEDET